MAQNVTIAGASYSDVPSIQIPKTGGGDAFFVDTSDATATETDIASGKIAYVNGEKVTGTLAEVSKLSMPNAEVAFQSGMIQMSDSPASKGIYSTNTTINLSRDASDFGSAIASKVFKGYTFTSRSGFCVSGTYEESGGSLPEGAVAVQMATGDATSTQIASGYNISITYGDAIIIGDSVAIEFSGTSSTLSSPADAAACDVLKGKYVRVGSSYGSTSYTWYYIPLDATFTIGGSTYSKTVTCDMAQKVTLQKVS